MNAWPDRLLVALWFIHIFKKIMPKCDTGKSTSPISSSSNICVWVRQLSSAQEFKMLRSAHCWINLESLAIFCKSQAGHVNHLLHIATEKRWNRQIQNGLFSDIRYRAERWRLIGWYLLLHQLGEGTTGRAWLFSLYLSALQCKPRNRSFGGGRCSL